MQGNNALWVIIFLSLQFYYSSISTLILYKTYHFLPLFGRTQHTVQKNSVGYLFLNNNLIKSVFTSHFDYFTLYINLSK